MEIVRSFTLLKPLLKQLLNLLTFSLDLKVTETHLDGWAYLQPVPEGRVLPRIRRCLRPPALNSPPSLCAEVSLCF